MWSNESVHAKRYTFNISLQCSLRSVCTFVQSYKDLQKLTTAFNKCVQVIFEQWRSWSEIADVQAYLDLHYSQKWICIFSKERTQIGKNETCLTLSHIKQICRKQIDTNAKKHNCEFKYLNKVENMVAKEEIACFEQFLLLSKCFQNSSAAKASECVYMWLISKIFCFYFYERYYVHYNIALLSNKRSEPNIQN